MAEENQQTGTGVSAQQLSELEEIIKNTSALHDEERQYWLDLLPTMTKEQIDQLQGIFEKEQKKMQDINRKYDGKLEKVGEKYLSRWDGEKARVKRIERRKKEQTHAEEAEEKAEELLEQW